MIIFQPQRFLSRRGVSKYANKINGILLDAGSGKNCRYNSYLNFNKKISIDFDDKKNPDIVANLENIPLNNESVDSILCTQVLNDLENPPQALEEFFRILKPGGYLVMIDDLMLELHNEPNDYWRFTPISVKMLLLKVGFKIEVIDKLGGFFASQAQNNIRYLINRFNLYDKKFIFGLQHLIKIYGILMIFLDKIDKSEVNKQFPISWLVVAKKISKINGRKDLK